MIYGKALWYTQIMRVLVVLFTMMFAMPVNAGYEVPAFSTSNFILISPIKILNKDTGKEYFLMGLKNPSNDIVSLQNLNAVLSGDELFCTVYTSGTWCNLETSDQILAQIIIDKGLALEDCESTHGQFGTCEFNP